MYKENIKKWTILIYADGNNEMEQVIYKSLLSCESVGSNEDVNVVFQIGRLGNYKNDEEDFWMGVRRYYVNKGNSTLIEDLGKSNMADPNNLYNFIKWGYETYKSEHYMVVLSDHGGDFIGCFTDESQEIPYIMGIPEMIKSINLINENLGYNIDILVLDMCYMNTVEILYEFGQKETPAVKTVITYMDYAAYDGLDYTGLVSLTETYAKIKDSNLFTKKLIDNLEFDLMALEINHNKLQTLKNLFSTAACFYDPDEDAMNPIEIVNSITPDNTQPDFIYKINDLLNSMVIHSKKEFRGLNISIKVTAKDTRNLIAFYRKLAFAKNNYWVKLLSSIPFDKQKRDISRVNVSLFNTSLPIIHHILNLNIPKING